MAAGGGGCAWCSLLDFRRPRDGRPRAISTRGAGSRRPERVIRGRGPLDRLERAARAGQERSVMQRSATAGSRDRQGRASPVVARVDPIEWTVDGLEPRSPFDGCAGTRAGVHQGATNGGSAAGARRSRDVRVPDRTDRCLASGPSRLNHRMLPADRPRGTRDGSRPQPLRNAPLPPLSRIGKARRRPSVHAIPLAGVLRRGVGSGTVRVHWIRHARTISLPGRTVGARPRRRPRRRRRCRRSASSCG